MKQDSSNVENIVKIICNRRYLYFFFIDVAGVKF